MTHPLVLFDLDGTLLVTGGASSRCILRAAHQVFGPAFAWRPVTVGLLDPQLLMELAHANHLDPSAAQQQAWRDRYLDALEQELDQRRGDVIVLPGVRETLNALSRRPGVTVGLLTGNFEPAARLKLAAAGIDPGAFAVICCAEHAATREALVVEAMRQCDPTVQPRHVVIVGDTPRDAACAHANGCRCLAVATGMFSADQLRDTRADAVVQNLDTGRAELDRLIMETLS